MCFLTRVYIEQQVPVAQPPAGVGGASPHSGQQTCQKRGRRLHASLASVPAG